MDQPPRHRPVPGAITAALSVLAALVVGTALLQGPGVPDLAPSQTPPAAPPTSAPAAAVA